MMLKNLASRVSGSVASSRCSSSLGVGGSSSFSSAAVRRGRGSWSLHHQLARHSRQWRRHSRALVARPSSTAFTPKRAQPASQLNSAVPFASFCSSSSGAGAAAAAAEVAAVDIAGTGHVRGTPLSHQPSQQLPGNWTCTAVTRSEEFDMNVFEYKHPSGAKYLHVERTDAENAFAVGFKTPVFDSTGVAHILEHTALCGSAKFPVRDPFFLLLRRSLKTYMNALTGNDYTIYPFSTVNEQDYANLRDVYLDASFFPRLTADDFSQEGHRLEFEQLDDSKSGLRRKGVVFNEMKGAMSDSGSIFIRDMLRFLFSDPSSTYHHNSGGEPSDIPDLTHEQLVEFHRNHYQPSNACFFSYGDMGPSLEAVDRDVLSHWAESGNKDASSIHGPQKNANQIRWDEPQVRKVFGPEDAMTPDPEKQTKVALMWLLPSLHDDDAPSVEQDPEAPLTEAEIDQVGLALMAHLLLDGPNAPMYQALIDPNIGNGYAPGTGFEDHFREHMFGVGLQGIREDDVDKVVDIILETLEKHTKEGFDEARVDAALHQVELGIKSVNTKYGVRLCCDMLPAWAHDTNPTAFFKTTRLIAAVRERMAQGDYLQQLLKKFVLDNPHRLTLIMSPDPEYVAKQEDIESKQVAAIEETLSEDDKHALIVQAQRLSQMQDEEPDASCLPTLTVDDIPRVSTDIDVLEPLRNAGSQGGEHGVTSSTSVFSCSKPTNTMAYFTGLLQTDSEHNPMPQHLRPYATMLATLLTSVGAAEDDYRGLSLKQEMYTGSYGVKFSLHSDYQSIDAPPQERLIFHGSALSRNVERLSELIGASVRDPHWHDVDRIYNLMTQHAASCAESLTDSGWTYAKMDAAVPLTPHAAINNELFGIPRMQFVKDLVVAGEDGMMQLHSRLVELTNWLSSREDLYEKMLMVGDESALEALHQAVPSFVASHRRESPMSPVKNASDVVSFSNEAERSRRRFISLPIKVNNAAMVVRGVPVHHSDSTALSVLSKLMSSKFLHRELREKGGAYGGGAAYDPMTGLYSFYSYRDPGLMSTVRSFQQAGEWIHSKDAFSDADIGEALLGIFSMIDAPRAPSAAGSNEFLTGITAEQLQERREALLSVTREDILRVAEQYVSPEILKDAHVSIVGNREQADIAQKEGFQHVKLDDDEISA